MKTILTILILFISVISSFAQTGRKEIRMGNKLYDKASFLDSEVKYRKALERNPSSFDAQFNLGDALYKQGKFDEAAKIFNKISTDNKSADQKKQLASSFYNLGNSLFKSKKLKESIEAYENSLRLNPHDMDAKYNLAYAKELLKKNNQKDKDNNKNKNKDDKNKNDKNKQNDKQKDQNNKNQQNNNPNQQQQQGQQPKISKDDAERILNALQNNENQVEQKVNEKKAEAVKVKVQKNW
ncbi:MAG TPA: tetratricopeptide repeat protein [Williamwhitmania sp.]|nr:tetratricopeptide repeat protein [Williamwhitmania sp.]